MKKIIFLLLIITTTLVGCSNIEKNNDTLDIVTSFYPMYIATANIIDGAENVSLTNLTNSAIGCLHDYQLTTADLIKVEKADILVINGGGMESFIQKVIDNCKNIEIINSSDGIIEQHMEEHHHDGDEHEQNSHIWVSISLYIKQVENICNKLIELDPNNSDIYRKNANEYILKLQELKKKMHDELDNVDEKNKNIVTFHEAFDYFAEEFDLNIVGIIEREPGTYPSAGELAEIITKIKAMDAKAIFVEPQYSKTVADTISRETNIPTYTLNPVVSGELNKDAYEKIMIDNLKNLVEALED